MDQTVLVGVISVIASFLGIVVSMMAVLNPLFKLHSRMDVTAYRLEKVEAKVDRLEELLQELLKRAS